MADDQTTDQPELTSGGQADPEPEPRAATEPEPGTATGPATEPEAGKQPPRAGAEKRIRKAGKSGRKLLTTLIAAVVLMMLLKIFVVQVYVIPSASMENTLMVGDR